jgi:hypothetical protein
MGSMPEAECRAAAPSRWRWLWIAWLAVFLAIETAAVKTRKAGRTLSANMWRWFPSWPWWAVVGTFLLALALHLSPLHITVVPVIVLGVVMAARIAWVESRGRRRP